MCLVEEVKSLKPIASCAIQILSNMQIYTNTIKVRKAREGVLEFLLINHPLDCPICDQGGECDLQDITKIYGADRGRFYEYKRAVFDKNFGPLIKTSMNRCIHRTRCVRYMVEICGFYNLGVLGRGGLMEIGTYITGFLNIEISGNVIDLCPVGALTSKPYAFRGRPWELKNLYAFDIFNIFLPAIKVCVRGVNILRILPVISSNLLVDSWISDFTRFFYDSLKRQRLLYPIITYYKNTLKLLRVSWFFILTYIKFFFSNELQFLLKNKYKFFEVLFSYNTFSDVYLLMVAKRFLTTTSLVFKQPVTNAADKLSLAFPDYVFINYNLFSTTTLLLIVGLNLRIDFPMVNIYVRNLVNKTQLTVYVLSSWCSYNYFMYTIKNISNVFVNILSGKHWLCPLLYKNNCTLLSSQKNKYFLSYLLDNPLFKNNFCFLDPAIKNTVLCELGLYDDCTSSILKKTWYFSNFLIYSIGFDYSYGFKPVFLNRNWNIYQGHTVDNAGFLSKILLPTLSIFEKTSCWLNIYGELKKDVRFLSHHKNCKSDWKVLNALFLACFKITLFSTMDGFSKYLLEVISPFFQNNHIIRVNLINFSFYNKLFFFRRCSVIGVFDNYIYDYLDLPVKMSTNLMYSLSFLKPTLSWFK
jgi:hypothetical protein